jgi:hypothetical protein
VIPGFFVANYCLLRNIDETLYNFTSMNTPEENFTALGLNLPPAPKPLGVYKPCLVDGKYLYLSGHGTVKGRWQPDHWPYW